MRVFSELNETLYYMENLLSRIKNVFVFANRFKKDDFKSLIKMDYARWWLHMEEYKNSIFCNVNTDIIDTFWESYLNISNIEDDFDAKCELIFLHEEIKYTMDAIQVLQ